MVRTPLNLPLIITMMIFNPIITITYSLKTPLTLITAGSRLVPKAPHISDSQLSKPLGYPLQKLKESIDYDSQDIKFDSETPTPSTTVKIAGWDQDAMENDAQVNSYEDDDDQPTIISSPHTYADIRPAKNSNHNDLVESESEQSDNFNESNGINTNVNTVSNNFVKFKFHRLFDFLSQKPSVATAQKIAVLKINGDSIDPEHNRDYITVMIDKLRNFDTQSSNHNLNGSDQLHNSNDITAIPKSTVEIISPKTVCIPRYDLSYKNLDNTEVLKLLLNHNRQDIVANTAIRTTFRTQYFGISIHDHQVHQLVGITDPKNEITSHWNGIDVKSSHYRFINELPGGKKDYYIKHKMKNVVEKFVPKFTSLYNKKLSPYTPNDVRAPIMEVKALNQYVAGDNHNGTQQIDEENQKIELDILYLYDHPKSMSSSQSKTSKSKKYRKQDQQEFVDFQKFLTCTIQGEDIFNAANNIFKERNPNINLNPFASSSGANGKYRQYRYDPIEEQQKDNNSNYIPSDSDFIRNDAIPGQCHPTGGNKEGKYALQMLSGTYSSTKSYKKDLEFSPSKRTGELMLKILPFENSRVLKSTMERMMWRFFGYINKGTNKKKLFNFDSLIDSDSDSESSSDILIHDSETEVDLSRDESYLSSKTNLNKLKSSDNSDNIMRFRMILKLPIDLQLGREGKVMDLSVKF